MTDKQNCPVSKKCGSCQYLHLSYAAQLAKKQKQVESLLAKFCKVHPIIGMENPWHYRNKVNAAFSFIKGKGLVSGIYEQGTHRVVPVKECLIEDTKADEIIQTIRKLAESFKIRAFDEDTGYGLLRHVMIRRGFATGQILVILVLRSPILPSKKNFVKALLDVHPEISSIVINVNDRHTSMVLGSRNITLHGKGYIEDVLCGKTFRISPDSFYQVNPVQTEILYNKAIQLAHLTGKETVIDAYCGIGTIGMLASDHAKEVIGIELNASAIKDARDNAKRNQCHNITFFCADAGEYMRKMAAEKRKADVVLMDPPRNGSTKVFMDSVKTLSPKKVVYVSCGQESLARDLQYFKKVGYKAEGAWPVDMFPWTGHVETVCLLSKLS